MDLEPKKLRHGTRRRLDMNAVYNTAEKLESCQYKSLDRRIGVTMLAPIYHHGCKKPMVEFYYERPIVNSETFGQYCEPHEWQEYALDMTESTIEHIDGLVKELKYHRNRLAAEAKALRESGDKDVGEKTGLRSAVRKALSRVWVTGAKVTEAVRKIEAS
jgi:hypothetical protein